MKLSHSILNIYLNKISAILMDAVKRVFLVTVILGDVVTRKEYLKSKYYNLILYFICYFESQDSRAEIFRYYFTVRSLAMVTCCL